MSHALYLLGQFAARRPWVVIGGWIAAAAIVVGASSLFGHQFDDSFGAPGLDSQRAADLLSSSRSEQAGLTADVVLTPNDQQASFFDSDAAQASLAKVERSVADL